MASDVILYSYPDTILELWAEWSTKYLFRKPIASNNLERGFQDLLGSTNSNDRSRALELYNIGLLRGLLSKSQVGGRAQPLGWSLLVSDEPVHTPLGYISYLIGSVNPRDNHVSISRAFSALSAVFCIQSHVLLPNGITLSYAAIFEWLRSVFPAPVGTSRQIWLRYLATGMFCTLKADSLSNLLIESLMKDELPKHVKLYFVWDDRTELVDYDRFCEILRSQPSVTNVRPRKHALFWLGAENDSRGLYSQANRYCSDFISAFANEELTALRNGAYSTELFGQFAQKNSLNETSDILRLLESLNKYPKLKIPLTNLMKSLLDGSINAIKQLEGSVSRITSSHSLSVIDFPHQKIFFGPPGTGKSYMVDKATKGHSVIRTTFHPDYDYASFVGSY